VRGGRAAGLDPLRVGYGYADAYAEPYYAQSLGWFKDAGFDVTLSVLGSGANLATAVAAGALDIGLSNTVNLADAKAHGAPFVMIAGAGMYTAGTLTQALMVTKTSPIRSAKDLAGKTVAVTALKDLTEVGTRLWIDRSGGDSRQVKFTEVPMGQMPGALERGTVDAVFIGEPRLSAIKADNRILATSYDAIAPRFLISEFFTTADYFAGHKELVRRFVDVIYKTAVWANAHQDASGAMLATFMQLDAATTRTMARVAYATSLDPKLIDPVLDAMAKYDTLDRRVGVDELVAK
jgi:NitT/TauT family transport system substrate-binding protein